MTQALFEAAADLIAQADGLIIAAGAGMGVDSGLPDFRGNQGFWRAYPALAEARIAFEEIACPDAFRDAPERTWGFYGHRLNLYRRTIPHAGFAVLKRWGLCLPRGVFVFTSNVDGQFQRAGFDSNQVCEVHGSIHHLQCVQGCDGRILSAEGWSPEVDEVGCRLLSPLPRCSVCGDLLRPNVLMFGDWAWLPQRTQSQRVRLEQWLAVVDRPVVVEIGAGSHVATVRWFSESMGVPLVRINPTEPEVPGRGVELPMEGLRALSEIDAVLAARGALR
ncbi:MAG TPA: Sir2 family NAD-dependent protein deacetylase [Rhodocyclaceae bacterium]|nr:Sir2 family NAD-dependent protein deacetylase [Rhodocyclaceae bacterium]